MNIIHISPVVYVDRLMTSSDLARTQAKSGHNVTVIGANGANRSAKKITVNDNLRVFLLPSIDFPHPSKVSSTSYVLGLSHLIEKLEPDILHIQTHLNLTAIKTVLLAKKFYVPVVTTIHGVTMKINPAMDLAQLAYLYTLGSIIFRNSHKIICLTKQDSLRVMALDCPPNKITVIPNGVDVDLFKSGEETEGALIVWHGRWVATKGLEYLIKAFALIVQSGNSRVKLALVGDGPLKQKLVGMTERLKLSENVIFVGMLASLAEVASFLSKTTVYALPSLREGMPWALLEAMSCGKPIVGSDISGINDVVTHGENGLLVPPMNPEALANGILQLLNDRTLRTRLGQNARQLMREKYSWDRITKRIEKVYLEAISAGSPFLKD